MRYVFFLALLCPFLSNCQPITLKGKIINEQMEPVAGATITLKRPATGSQQLSSVIYQLSSDPKGEFTLTGILLTDTLIITAIGYETAVETLDFNSRGLITIILKRKTALLEEVVVNTGYQQLPKERSTGSFIQVNNQALNLQTGPNIIDRLNGVASSMLFQPKIDGPPYTIRGLSTILGPKAPLVILDNFPYEGDVNNINPADVESITLLKDAAAASIWGTRAGNGVIVITTKKGRLNQPLKIGFNTGITITPKPDLYRLPLVSASDFIDLEQFLFSKNYYQGEINNSQRPALSPVVELLLQKAAGTLSKEDAEAQIDAFRQHDVRSDYLTHFYQKAVNRQYALNLQGGGSNSAYYLSAGIDKNTSELGAGYNRYSLRSQNTFHPLSRLQLTVTLAYSQTKTASGKPAWNSILVGSRRIPYLRFTEPGGAPAAIAKNLRQTYTDTAGGGMLLNWKYYPLEDYQHNTTTANAYDLLGTVSLQYKLGSSFTIEGSYQLQRLFSETDNLQDAESYNARDVINRYSQLNRAAGSVKYIIPQGGILNRSVGRMEARNLRSQLSFNKQVNRHQVALMAGAELREVHNAGNSNTVYGYDPDVITYANVDFVNAYPNFISGSNSFISNGLSFSETLNRFVSLYINGAYTWKERYTLSASARKDASNLFGLKTNDKWNPFWSAGGSWTLSREPFYHSAALPYLRLRASFGYSGNADQSKSAVTTLVYTGAALYTNWQTAQVSQFANPGLRWEKVAMLNIGLDFAGKAHRWSGSLEYYIKKGTDLFGSSLIDYTAGLNRTSITANVAGMQGRGVDLTFNTLLIKGALSWTASVLASYNMATTTRYYRSTILASTYVSNGSTITAQEGKPLYAVISYPWAGLDPATGDPRGYLNGAVSTNYNAITGNGTRPADLVYAGPALPRYFGGFLNTLSWKNWGLSVNLLYKLGYYFRKESIAYGTLFSAGIGHADYAKRWQQPGDERITNVPSLVYPLPAGRDAFYLSSEATVAKADHIRLQFVNLSYNLATAGRRPFKSLQLRLSVSNLGVLWRANHDGLDPDYAASIPPSKSFALTLTTEF